MGYTACVLAVATILMNFFQALTMPKCIFLMHCPHPCPFPFLILSVACAIALPRCIAPLAY